MMLIYFAELFDDLESMAMAVALISGLAGLVSWACWLPEYFADTPKEDLLNRLKLIAVLCTAGFVLSSAVVIAVPDQRTVCNMQNAYNIEHGLPAVKCRL